MDRSYKELIFDIYYGDLTPVAQEKFRDFCAVNNLDGIENYEYLPIATLEIYPDEEEEVYPDEE
jgi:hypothetical protein